MTKRLSSFKAVAASAFLVATGLALSFLGRPPTDGSVTREDLPPEVHAQKAFENAPISFEANVGQTDPSVQFLARVAGSTVFLTPHGMAVRLPGRSAPQTLPPLERGRREPEPEIASATVEVNLIESNRAARAEGLDRLSQKTHYYRGNDPREWYKNVPNYSRVKYYDVYPGVDLVYYSRQRQIEYDFVVSPGADPAAIRFAFDGVDDTLIDPQGNLVAHTTAGELRHAKPLVYQEVDGRRQEITSRYRHAEDETFVFELASYNPSLPLVIDPMVDVAVLAGGSGPDFGIAIAVDENDNFIFGGDTDSVTFLNQPTDGNRDGFITVLAEQPLPAALSGDQTPEQNGPEFANYVPVATLILGGSEFDFLTDVDVGPNGRMLAVGCTGSPDFPQLGSQPPKVLMGASDGFFASLTLSGPPTEIELSASMLIGGPGSDCFIEVERIPPDEPDDGPGPHPSAFVFGGNVGAGFPGTAPGTFQGGDDILVGAVRVDAAGDIDPATVSRYFGGPSNDFLSGTFVDRADGRIYFTGGVPGGPDGIPDWGVGFVGLPDELDDLFAGGFGAGKLAMLEVDAGVILPFGIFREDDYVYSGADSGAPSLQADDGVPVPNPGGFSVYVGVWDKELERLDRIDVHGGSGADNGAAIIRGLDSIYYLCGDTQSPDFPQVRSIQPDHAGGRDMFVIKCLIDRKQEPPESKILYSTFFGGPDDELVTEAGVENWGNPLLIGWSGPNFPRLSGPGFGGGTSDAFLARFKTPHVPSNAVVGGGGFQPGPISPGKIISVFGHWVGARKNALFTLDEELRFPKELAETQCLFIDESGTEHVGAMLFSSKGQTNCVAPYTLPDTGEVWFHLVNKGIYSNPVDLEIRRVCPDIFNLGGGQAAVVNLADGRVNGPNTPRAARLVRLDLHHRRWTSQLPD